MMTTRLSPAAPPRVRMEGMSIPTPVEVALDESDGVDVVLVEDVSVVSIGSGGGPVI